MQLHSIEVVCSVSEMMVKAAGFSTTGPQPQPQHMHCRAIPCPESNSIVNTAICKRWGWGQRSYREYMMLMDMRIPCCKAMAWSFWNTDSWNKQDDVYRETDLYHSTNMHKQECTDTPSCFRIFTGHRHTHIQTDTLSLRSLEAWEAQQCSAVVNCELRGSAALELWSVSQESQRHRAVLWVKRLWNSQELNDYVLVFGGV